MNTHYLNPLLQPQHPQFLSGTPIMREYEIEDPRVVMRLVNNLKYLFNIQEGDHLTFILGHGECHSNNEALKNWVLEQLTQNPVGQDDVLAFLVESLKVQLMAEVYS